MRYKEHTTDQSRFYALFHAAVEAIVVIDADGTISDANEAFEELFGYSTGDVIGNNVSCLMPEPDRSQHDHYIKKYEETGTGTVIGTGREVIAQHKQGHTFPIYLSVGYFETPAVKGYVGILRDLSQIKETERQLQQTTVELERTLHYAPVAIFTLNHSGAILKANRVAQEMLGIDEENPSTIQALTCPDDREAQTALLDNLCDLGSGSSTQRRLHYIAADKQELLCLGHYAVVPATEGDASFIILELADQTPMVNAELEAAKHRESLALAGRVGALGEMAASIAHELNQPLTAITLYAQTAQRALQGGADVSDLLGKIADQSQRAGRVIKQIRTLISSDGPEHERLELRALAAEALNLAEVDARAHGVTLLSELDGPSIWVSGDSVQLQQVILNLLRNAFDAVVAFKPAKPMVKIEASVENQLAKITVCDNGPGVAATVLPKLFEPFASGKANGMGIGLSLSHSIAQSHQGALSYKKLDSAGACFTLCLPLSPLELN